MSHAYLVWKVLHLAGAVLMLGNVTVTGVWAALLWRNRSEVPFRQIARGILWTDLWFTLGGGALMVIAGIQMIRLGAVPWRETFWLWRGILAFGATTAIWLVALLPDQWRMEQCDPADEIRFGRLFRRWNLVGWMATAALYWGLWIMVTKPI